MLKSLICFCGQDSQRLYRLSMMPLPYTEIDTTGIICLNNYFGFPFDTVILNLEMSRNLNPICKPILFVVIYLVAAAATKLTSLAKFIFTIG